MMSLAAKLRLLNRATVLVCLALLGVFVFTDDHGRFVCAMLLMLTSSLMNMTYPALASLGLGRKTNTTLTRTIKIVGITIWRQVTVTKSPWVTTAYSPNPRRIERSVVASLICIALCAIATALEIASPQLGITLKLAFAVVDLYAVGSALLVFQASRSAAASAVSQQG